MESKSYPIPDGWLESHFPKCISCGEQLMVMGGVYGTDGAICSDCVEKELKRRSEVEPDGRRD